MKIGGEKEREIMCFEIDVRRICPHSQEGCPHAQSSVRVCTIILHVEISVDIVGDVSSSADNPFFRFDASVLTFVQEVIYVVFPLY